LIEIALTRLVDDNDGEFDLIQQGVLATTFWQRVERNRAVTQSTFASINPCQNFMSSHVPGHQHVALIIELFIMDFSSFRGVMLISFIYP
jgi:hypothetical protein